MSLPAEIVIAQRNRQRVEQSGIPPIKCIPDSELVDLLVRLGVPKFRAVELHWNPQKRWEALRLWAIEQDALDGDRQARQDLDMVRAMLAAQRREELISDNPDRGHTDLVDPRELLK